MMKYLLCMLLGAFLMLGLGQIPDRESQEFREGTGMASIQPDNSSTPDAVKPEVKPYCHTIHAIGSKGYTYNLGEGMPSNLILTRNISPFKILKFNNAAVTLQLLSHLTADFSDSSTTDKNLTKYSYRYFVYVLKHILI